MAELQDNFYNRIIKGELKLTDEEKSELVKGANFVGLVDKDGHSRFIEGEITLDDVPSGVVKKYGKWSLSGSHLLIVLALQIANGVELDSSKYVANVEIPEWIYNKVYPVTGQRVDNKSATAYNANTSSNQTIAYYLNKKPTPKVLGIFCANVTMTDERFVRLAFDLLIDNE